MPDARNILIAKVQAGRLTPAEAEAEAARLELGPLQVRPDPAAYDPTRELWWTLPMAVAWIAYRTTDAIREWWPEYRDRCTHFLYREAWRSSEASGSRLMPYAKASLQTLRLSERLDDRADRDPEFSMTVEDAVAALLSGLRASCFEATGLADGSNDREPIPDTAWRDLQIVESLDDVVRPRSGIGRSYRDVLVPMRAVRGLWSTRPPAPEPVSLPPPMAPAGGGYMPLYCAAQWIATEGGKLDFDGRDVERWRPAFAELLARIASEEVKVIGFRDGRNELLPGYRFAGVRVVHPFEHTPLDLILSDEMHLQSYCYTDEASWLNGLCDTLEQYRREKWERVSVLKSDVAAHWPLKNDTKLDPPDLPLDRTGAPGRPSAMHLVQAEFERRCAAGQVESSLAQEGLLLAAWLKSVHPTLRPAMPRTIENGIRTAYRKYKNPQK